MRTKQGTVKRILAMLLALAVITAETAISYAPAYAADETVQEEIIQEDILSEADEITSSDDSEDTDIADGTWKAQWQVAEQAAVVMLDIPAIGEDAPESAESVTLYLFGEHETESDEASDKEELYDISEALYEKEVSLQQIQSEGFELPVNELEPGSYVLSIYTDGEEAFRDNFHVVIYSSGKETVDELYVTENTFYVPAGDDSAQEDITGEDTEGSTAENGTETNIAEDATEDSIAEDEAREIVEENNTEAGIAEDEEPAKEEAGDDEGDELLLSQLPSLSVYLNTTDKTDNFLYVNLDAETTIHENVAFVVSDSEDYDSGTKYYIFTEENVTNGSHKMTSHPISGSGFRFSAGTWYVFAAILKDENPEYPFVVSGNSVKLFVPQIPYPVDIIAAGSGGGSFKLLSENKYNDLPISIGTPDKIEYGLADSETFIKTSANSNNMGLAPGTYIVRFLNHRLDNNEWYAAASDWMSFVIPEKDTPVNKIEFWGNEGATTHITMYKGQTKLLPLRFNGGSTPQPTDTSVIYTSSDPKTVSVDAAGNIKALKVTTTEVTITAQSVADPSVTGTLKVNVHAPLKIKFAKSSVSANWKDPVTLDYTVTPATSMVELGYNIDSFSVASSDSNVWEVPLSKTAYMTLDTSTGKGTIKIEPSMSVAPGKTVITLTDPMGDFATCELSLNGISGKGTSSMRVIKGGAIQTGWIYIDASGNLTSKNKAKEIYYIDPVSKAPAIKSGILRIGKELYTFNSDYTLNTNYENQPSTEFGGIYYGKDGKLKTGWQQDRYYDPETGLMVKNAFVPYGNGTAYVGNDGSRFESGFNTTIISGKKYYFENEKIKTGWIYLDASDKPVAKGKAKYWYYADPVSGTVLKTSGLGDVCMIAKKLYFVRADGQIEHFPGLIDVEKNSKVDLNDYFAGSDGAILTNKAYSFAYDGTKYYLGEDGHIRTGMFFFDGKVINTNYKGAEIETCIIMHRCLDDNTGNSIAYGKSVNGNMQFYTDGTHKYILKNEWIRTTSFVDKDKAEYCYLNGSGKMVKGFQTINGKKYYFDENTGYVKVGERWGPNNIFYNEIMTAMIKGKQYLLENKSGAFPGSIMIKQPGIKKDNSGAKYYIDANGACQSGWKTIDGKKYYFRPDDWEMATSDVYIKGKCYAIKSDGSLYPEGIKYGSEMQINGYIQKDGSYKTGWIYLNRVNGNLTLGKNAASAAYIFYTSPFTEENLQYSKTTDYLYRIGGKYYTVDVGNPIAKGWKYLHDPVVIDVDTSSVVGSYSDDYFFYFDPVTGAAATGLKSVDSYPQFKNGKPILNSDNTSIRIANSTTPVQMYFETTMNSDRPAGALLLDESVSVSGKLYTIGNDGKVQAGMKEGFADEERTQYRYDNGTMATGRVKVGNVFYYFDPSDGTVQKGCLRLSNRKWYYYDDAGKQTQKTDFSTVGGEKVTPVYASDGSISYFKYALTDKKVSNVIITGTSEGDTVIGKNGLPSVGLVNHTSGTYYYEADGKPYYTDGDNMLIKIGKKYYMCNDGKMLVGKNEIQDFADTFSEAELGYFELLDELHSYLSDTNLYCYTADDGSVLAGKYVSDVHTGTYGIRVDIPEAVQFYKFGGKWYVPEQTGLGEQWIHFIGMQGGVDARVLWKQGGILQGVYDKSGKPLNGFFYYIVGSSEYYVLFKNGIPQTGKQTVDLGDGFKVKMEFDKDCGIMYSKLAMH